MLKSILSISGKGGLFKLISQAKNMLIVESLSDKKRIPVYPKDKVISLGDIAVYKVDEEVPLYKVLNNIKEKENGEKIQPYLLSANVEELRKYMEEILPDFDRERVYPSDIRKIALWYNLLIDSGFTDFSSKEEKKEDEEEKKEEDNKEDKPEE